MQIKDRIKTKTFISWLPLLIYLSTDLGNEAILFDEFRFNFVSRYNDDGVLVVFIHLVYLGMLIGLTPKVEKILADKVQEQKIIFFHGVSLTLVVLLGALFMRSGFDVTLKLGVVWSITLILWFFESRKV